MGSSLSACDAPDNATQPPAVQDQSSRPECVEIIYYKCLQTIIANLILPQRHFCKRPQSGRSGAREKDCVELVHVEGIVLIEVTSSVDVICSI